jgi:hypothetical protein
MARKFVLPLFLAPSFVYANLQDCNAQQKGVPVAVHQVHSAHGPHGGELLEIGKNEFHAELVVDEAKKQLVVYLLEADAKSSLAIEVPTLTVNLILAGKPMQIQLKAIPQEADARGFSSCFGAVSSELIDALHSTKSDPKLATRIRNKSYVTKIVHKHDHSGHNHAQQPAASPTKKR